MNLKNVHIELDTSDIQKVLPIVPDDVQPLALLLNGLTALFATFGFAKSGYG